MLDLVERQYVILFFCPSKNSFLHTQNFYIWQDIEVGAEFYFDENDYLHDTRRVKVELSQSTISSPPAPSPHSLTNSSRGKKRPRRTAAETVRSYAVPDSDEDDQHFEASEQDDQKDPRETSLQLWIKHLGLLLKMETRKVSIAEGYQLSQTDLRNNITVYCNEEAP